MTDAESPELKVAVSTLRKFKRLSQNVLISKFSTYQMNHFVETVFTDTVHTLNEIEELLDKNSAKCTSKHVLEGPEE
jgi:hypothetical protein